MISIFQLLDKTFKKPKTITPTKPQGVPAPAYVKQVVPVATPVIAKIPETIMTKQLVTLSILRQLFPRTGVTVLESFIEPINKYCTEYKIDTKLRLAAFLAQVGHESGGLNTLKENLNYSQDALLKTFKKYFPSAALAASYARNPVAIGNRVYANRMGNGDEKSGDGFNCRGLGAIQLTGRSNQSKFAFWVKKTLPQAQAYLTTPEGAILGAIWFWTQSHDLNTLADAGKFTEITQVINGGQNGAVERLALYKKALKLLP